MLRSDLIEMLAKQNDDLDTATIERVVENVLSQIIERLAAGGRVELRGFGIFSVRRYEEATGRNPRTGARIEVPAKRRPFFRPGRALAKRVNASVRANAETDQ